jgi:hypothetical protein
MSRHTSARSVSPTASLRIEVRNPVKKITLAVLLLLAAFAWAGTPPNPAEYTVNVHVSRSRIKGIYQNLNVVVNGRKYELENSGDHMLLALGDYKAKLVKDEHKGTYDSLQIYEFLLPDQKTSRFVVIGQTE